MILRSLKRDRRNPSANAVRERPALRSVFDKAFFSDFIHMDSVSRWSSIATNACKWSGIST